MAADGRYVGLLFGTGITYNIGNKTVVDLNSLFIHEQDGVFWWNFSSQRLRCLNSENHKFSAYLI